MRESRAAPISGVGGISLNPSGDKAPVRRNGGGDRPARGYSWPPFEKGNTARLTHGLFSRQFSPLDEDEIAETAEALRAVMPTYAVAFEPALQLLAARLWRLRRAYAFVAATSEGDLPRNFSEKLGSLELLVNRTLKELGLTPVSASELGVNLAKLREWSEDAQPPFEWNNLEPAERKTLELLLAKGRRSGGE